MRINLFNLMKEIKMKLNTNAIIGGALASVIGLVIYEKFVKEHV